MKSARVLQPDLFVSVVPFVQPLTAPKPQAATRPRKAKSHRTETGDRCDGAVQIPGLGHSLCDRCGEWIATKHF